MSTPTEDQSAPATKAAPKLPRASEHAAPQEHGLDGEKTLMGVLRQDVSIKSIKELLFYDILPSKKDTGLDETEDYDPEHVEDPNLVSDSVGNILVDRGLIDKTQLEAARAHGQRTGQPLLRSLLQMGSTLPQEINALLHMKIPLPIGNLPDDQFVCYLIDEGVVTKKELEDAWSKTKEQKIDFHSYLRANSIVSDQDLAKALAHQANLAFDPLDEIEEIPEPVLRLLPTNILMSRKAIPLRLEEDTLYVAFADVLDIIEFEKMELMLNHKLQAVIVPRERLRLLTDANVTEQHAYLDQTNSDTGPVEMLNTILRGLTKCNGTDIHIEPQKNAVRIRYRVDGLLHDVMTLDLTTARRVIGRIKTMADMDVVQTRLPQDGHLFLDIGDSLSVDFRVATAPCNLGEKVALRMVQSHMAFSTFSQLGMNQDQQEVMDRLLSSASGMILVTGPVGAGKTTTLYSCLSCMDCLTHNIMTVEDPVEYELTGGCQIEVNEKIGVTFAAGLRAILRQDPDVILVGEIRDEETANVAIRASMTGQLVFSTLHANSASTAVTSLLNLRVAPYLVSQAVTGVLFQRLVRCICSECKEPYRAPDYVKQVLGRPVHDDLTLYRGKGCKKCLHTGYQGRVGAFELLQLDDDYRRIVINNPTSRQLRDAAIKSGMQPLYRHARELALAGVTTVEEAQRIL
jgi:type II secretory ATPase GspE/PulE/Tfp pilus assembly ATPase PilB-like protein